MKFIPDATPVALTSEEREALEAVAGSRTCEARMRDRARIVLLASAGKPSRAIAREIGCTPGTASKWRVRYASERMAGLSDCLVGQVSFRLLMVCRGTDRLKAGALRHRRWRRWP
jgi:hypothetical protein